MSLVHTNTINIVLTANPITVITKFIPEDIISFDLINVESQPHLKTSSLYIYIQNSRTTAFNFIRFAQHDQVDGYFINLKKKVGITNSNTKIDHRVSIKSRNKGVESNWVFFFKKLCMCSLHLYIYIYMYICMYIKMKCIRSWC